MHPLSFYGRTIVTKEQSENMPDNVIFQQALLEIFKNEDILKHVETSKFEVQDKDYFLKDIRKVSYDVKLTIIPKKQIPTDKDVMQACIDQVKESGFDVGFIDPEFVEKFK